jgi:hypothetical protein
MALILCEEEAEALPLPEGLEVREVMRWQVIYHAPEDQAVDRAERLPVIMEAPAEAERGVILAFHFVILMAVEVLGVMVKPGEGMDLPPILMEAQRVEAEVVAVKVAEIVLEAEAAVV